MDYMEWLPPMPCSEKLPKRSAGGAYSDDVLVYVHKAQRWLVGAFMFDEETGNAGSWGINGEVVDSAEVSHWVPLPPAP
jgi:hypothetical protein